MNKSENENSQPNRSPEITVEKTTPEKPAAPPWQPVNQIAQDHKKHNHSILWLTVIILIITIGCVLAWLLYFQFHESTDDAYVNGNMINVTTVISGTPIAFFADDTDLVVKGQLLVQLDSTPHKIAFNKELRQLAETVLQVRQLYDRVTENRANVGNKLTTAKKALYDFKNRRDLVDSKAVSDEEFVHSRDDFINAKLALQKAKAQLQIAIDAAGTTPLEQHPQIETQKAAVRQAFYNLKHCNIYAPVSGYIAQRSVEVGQWVTTNTFMMAIIPTDYIWVDANFKETQLAYMRIGQPATVTVDLYGSGVKFNGKVIGIASGTGSVFSIIPPQNATGNWIKIVQRLPVRISIDPKELEKYPLRLGLSAYVNVNISDDSGAMLAQTPSTKAITTTNVFDLDFTEVEEIMDKTIKDNL